MQELKEIFEDKEFVINELTGSVREEHAQSFDNLIKQKYSWQDALSSWVRTHYEDQVDPQTNQEDWEMIQQYNDGLEALYSQTPTGESNYSCVLSGFFPEGNRRVKTVPSRGRPIWCEVGD